MTRFATGVVTEIDPAIGNVLSFAILIAPVTLVFAGLEAGVRQATVVRGRRWGGRKRCGGRRSARRP